MKKALKVLVIMVIAIYSISAIVFADDKINKVPKTATATAPEIVKDYRIDVDGNNFSITIDENATTGYKWEFTVICKNGEKAEEMVKLLHDELLLPDTELVGGGGQHLFEFEALQQGVCAIRFDYKRSWEKEAIKSVQFVVYLNEEGLFVEEDIQMQALDDENLKKEFKRQQDEGTIGIAITDDEEITEPLIVDGLDEDALIGIEADEETVKVGFFKSILNFFSNLFSKIFG